MNVHEPIRSVAGVVVDFDDAMRRSCDRDYDDSNVVARVVAAVVVVVADGVAPAGRAPRRDATTSSPSDVR